jgi:hypothetical protein
MADWFWANWSRACVLPVLLMAARPAALKSVELCAPVVNLTSCATAEAVAAAL